jgi:hypothetical protein
MVTSPLYISPLRERNLEKWGDLENGCISCGKPLKDENSFVHMNTDWLAVRSDIIAEEFLEKTGAESQGLFPIGNDCAKRMKGFTIKLDLRI